MAISSNNRVSLVATAPQYFQGPAAALRPTGGIVFPNQPDVVYSQSVNYSPYELVHTNYTFNAYRNTPSPSIQVTAQFTQTTEDEHLYTQGVLHFLRSVTKMYYGFGDVGAPAGAEAGTPPPVLRFSGYGPTVFNAVPVLVATVSVPFQTDTDLIEVNGVALPTVLTVALDLMVQQSPAKQKQQFSKAAFLSGQAYGNGFI
jgi:hypothetical protein